MEAKNFIENQVTPLHIHISAIEGIYILKQDVIKLMEEYHQAKLKLLHIPLVVGQSEQLLAFLEWVDQSPEENANRSREDLVKDYLSQ